MSISNKDNNTLINKPNNLLADYHARIAVYEMPEAVLNFYELNKDKINGEVVIVRSKDDEAHAAKIRNTCEKVLFVFGVNYLVTSYFSGVCEKITLPKALVKRVNNGKDW